MTHLFWTFYCGIKYLNYAHCDTLTLNFFLLHKKFQTYTIVIDLLSIKISFDNFSIKTALFLFQLGHLGAMLIGRRILKVLKVMNGVHFSAKSFRRIT